MLRQKVINVSVAIYSMMPYTRLEIKDGRLRAGGCVGEVWNTLTHQLPYRVRSVFSDTYNDSTDVILAGATDEPTHGTRIPFLTSWYDIHVEESLATTTQLSYIPDSWIAYLAMVVTYALALYAMMKCSDKFCPSVSVVDLPPEPSMKDEWRVRKSVPRWRWQEYGILYRKLRAQNEESLGNCIMASIAANSSQGCYVHTHVFSIQLLIVSFLVFGLVMSSAYSGSLISQFTIHKGSVEDYEASGKTICVRPNTSPQLTVNHYTQAVEDETCEQFLCNGQPVMETNEVMNYREFRYSCRFRPLNIKRFRFDLHVEVTENTPNYLKEDIRERMITLRENGITSRISAKWLLKRKEFLADKIPEVSLPQVRTPFLLYFSLLTISFLIFWVEVIFYRGYQWID